MERSLSCTGLHVACRWFPRGRKQRETNPVIDSPAICKEVLGLGKDKEHEANLVEALCMGVVLVAREMKWLGMTGQTAGEEY